MDEIETMDAREECRLTSMSIHRCVKADNTAHRLGSLIVAVSEG